VRKSLGIDNMDDVELLVTTFYEYSDKFKEERKRAMEAEEMKSQPTTTRRNNQPIEEAEKRFDSKQPSGERAEGLEEEEADEDKDELTIDLDSVVEILRDFHKRREDIANNAELIGNPRMKKRSNFETEEQKKERTKREEKKFWEKMTTVLSESKQSVWHALDKALSKYYALLVDRQNLIEETGLLN